MHRKYALAGIVAAVFGIAGFCATASALPVDLQHSSALDGDENASLPAASGLTPGWDGHTRGWLATAPADGFGGTATGSGAESQWLDGNFAYMGMGMWAPGDSTSGGPAGFLDTEQQAELTFASMGRPHAFLVVRRSALRALFRKEKYITSFSASIYAHRDVPDATGTASILGLAIAALVLVRRKRHV